MRAADAVLAFYELMATPGTGGAVAAAPSAEPWQYSGGAVLLRVLLRGRLTRHNVRDELLKTLRTIRETYQAFGYSIEPAITTASFDSWHDDW